LRQVSVDQPTTSLTTTTTSEYRTRSGRVCKPPAVFNFADYPDDADVLREERLWLAGKITDTDNDECDSDPDDDEPDSDDLEAIVDDDEYVTAEDEADEDEDEEILPDVDVETSDDEASEFDPALLGDDDDDDGTSSLDPEEGDEDG